MRQEYEITEIGRQLGTDAVEHAAHCAEQYCLRERTRLELANEPKINALHVEGAKLTRAVRDIEERLRLAPRPGETRSRKRRVRYYWTTGILLAIAGFGFALVALAPFRLGPIGTLYSLGIALVTPFATEAFLELWSSEHFVRAAASAVFAAAIVGGMLLGSIRSQLLARQVEDPAPSVVIDGESAAPQSQQPSFYESTRNPLGWLLVLMALAIDLGAGVAVHRAIQVSKSGGEDFKMLSRELMKGQVRLGEIVYEMTALRNDPAIFEAGFWRDYYRAMLTRTMRKAMSKLPFLTLALLFLAPNIRAQQRLDLFVAIDLSRSEAVSDRYGHSEFSKNVQRVGELLGQVPAGTNLIVLGISENSFSEPYILLSAAVKDDPGYFGERLTVSRRQLVQAWHKRSIDLRPRAQLTDILGALFVASDWFKQQPASHTKSLVIYSDMDETATRMIPGIYRQPDSSVPILIGRHLIARFDHVGVYCVGVDASDRSLSGWLALKEFWTGYFRESGGKLLAFCNLCTTNSLGTANSFR